MNITETGHQYNVFLIGNNPQEISLMETNLTKFNKINFIAEVGFDLGKSLHRVFKANPSYILLDDCYPVQQLKKFIKRIRQNNKTQNIPIAILKSSNKHHIRVEGIQDFFLKDNFSADRLFYAIKNSRKIRRTQIVLYNLNKRSRRKYQSFMYFLRNLFSGSNLSTS
jgi:CheY-like chemotaxis protein